MSKKKPDFGKIKLLAMDVDGVLTDGNVIISNSGFEAKSFNLVDGHGIRMWRRAGLKTALISGRPSEATILRAGQLEIEYVINGCEEKLPVFEKILADAGLKAEEAAYIGDDVLDIPIVRRAGFGVAVANAVDELKEYSDYITTRKGGSGAVREVVELILKKAGRWDELMERYLV